MSQYRFIVPFLSFFLSGENWKKKKKWLGNSCFQISIKTYQMYLLFQVFHCLQLPMCTKYLRLTHSNRSQINKNITRDNRRQKGESNWDTFFYYQLIYFILFCLQIVYLLLLQYRRIHKQLKTTNVEYMIQFKNLRKLPQKKFLWDWLDLDKHEYLLKTIAMQKKG